MKVNGIFGKAKTKFKAAANSRHNLPVAENLTGQNFFAESHNAKWISDIRQVWTMEGRLYPAAIIAFHSPNSVYCQ